LLSALSFYTLIIFADFHCGGSHIGGEVGGIENMFAVRRK
jgi:hypothetical protein